MLLFGGAGYLYSLMTIERHLQKVAWPKKMKLDVKKVIQLLHDAIEKVVYWVWTGVTRQAKEFNKSDQLKRAHLIKEYQKGNAVSRSKINITLSKMDEAEKTNHADLILGHNSQFWGGRGTTGILYMMIRSTMVVRKLQEDNRLMNAIKETLKAILG